MTLAVTRGRVWEVRLDRPHRANALSAELVDDLLALLDEAAAAHPDVLVLRGNDRHFAAGLDLSGLDDETDASLAHRLVRIGLLLERLQTAPFLTVAVVEGPAVGAGADLAAACDHRVGTDAATFRFPGAVFGVVLGVPRLARLCGADTARTLVSGTTLDAVAAHAHGLLTEVTADPSAAVTRQVTAWSGVDPSARRALLAALRGPTPDDSALAALTRSVARPGLRRRVASYATTTRTLAKETP